MMNSEGKTEFIMCKKEIAAEISDKISGRKLTISLLQIFFRDASQLDKFITLFNY